jgi:hypothetical protein
MGVAPVESLATSEVPEGVCASAATSSGWLRDDDNSRKGGEGEQASADGGFHVSAPVKGGCARGFKRHHEKGIYVRYRICDVAIHTSC